MCNWRLMSERVRRNARKFSGKCPTVATNIPRVMFDKLNAYVEQSDDYENKAEFLRDLIEAFLNDFEWETPERVTEE